MLDMGDRRIGDDAMAEIEDMGARRKSRKDAVDRRIERLAARDERQRVEIALHRQMIGQGRIGPDGVDRFVQSAGIDPGPTTIGGEFTAPPFRKADQRRVGHKALPSLYDSTPASRPIGKVGDVPGRFWMLTNT